MNILWIALLCFTTINIINKHEFAGFQRWHMVARLDPSDSLDENAPFADHAEETPHQIHPPHALAPVATAEGIQWRTKGGKTCAERYRPSSNWRLCGWVLLPSTSLSSLLTGHKYKSWIVTVTSDDLRSPFRRNDHENSTNMSSLVHLASAWIFLVDLASMAIRMPGGITWKETGALRQHEEKSLINVWLVVSTPLKNMSQLGSLFPIYGKIIQMFQTTNRMW